jgi:glycine C-acetyltransferase
MWDGVEYDRLEACTELFSTIIDFLLENILSSNGNVVTATNSINQTFQMTNDFPIFMTVIDISWFRPDIISPESPVPTGIGAKPYLDRLQNHLGLENHHATIDKMIELQDEYWPASRRRLTPVDIEYISCENRKYFSYINGTKTLKEKTYLLHMNDANQHFAKTLSQIETEGLYKKERTITTPQGVDIKTKGGGKVLNFCANNYLGLANHPELIEAAKQALDEHGFGMASVRFICGTQDLHKSLESSISKFLGTDDTILYTSCFDANGGLFETLLGPEDAIISDALNHASIIDGIRLCKAQRFRYTNNNMADLEAKLIEAKNARIRLIATDGVFSMDGYIANLKGITDLAEKYNALVMVDDSHATGFVGKTGRGSAEHNGVLNKIDIFTSTLGKALGGASGGFTSGNQNIIDLLRQRSRPYLFSNSVAPSIVAAGLKAFELLSSTTELRDLLEENTSYFRSKMADAGFDLKEGVHPIVPIMLYDAVLAQDMAAALLNEGIYVIGFFFPVVPKGEARIRVQISAGMDKDHLDRAVLAFTKVGNDLGVLS